MKYQISHTTRYHYTEAVPICHNEVRLIPRQEPTQRCENSRLLIQPTPAHRNHRSDYFGNAVLSFSISAHAVSRFRNSDGAVVVGEEVELRSGPGNAFERIATLRDGVEVRLKSRSAMWVEVELPTGEVGWLRDTEIQKISPPRR